MLWFALLPPNSVALERGKKRGKECGPDGYGVDEHVLARGMCSVADGSEAVQRGDAERGSKISVGTATGGAFAQRKIHFLGEQLGAREKSGAHSTFERGPVEAAGHFKPGAGLNRAQAVQAYFEAAHVGNAKRAEIEDRASAFRDYIGARAAFKDAGVDRDATARIVPLLDARELPRQFVNGVDAFLWSKTRVRSAAMHDQLGFTDALARRLQQPARAKRGFEDQNGVTATRFRFEIPPRRFAANLLVRGPEEDEAFAKMYFRVLKGLQREKRLHNSSLHIEDARSIGLAASYAKRHFGECSTRIDRIVVA